MAPPVGAQALVAGRWDDAVLLVDLDAPAAPVRHLRVTPDLPDGRGPARGLPSNLLLAPDGRHAFVVNHAGATDPAEVAAFPHGHAGALAVVDLTGEASPLLIPTGGHGPVGIAAVPGAPDLLLLSHAEGAGTEDGGRSLAVIDAAVRRVVARCVLRATGMPARAASPHADFGRFPNPNGLAVSPLCGGLAFTANGGTDDVSVLHLDRLLAGAPDAEIARVPVETGPFGLAVSPDGALLAVANRESARTERAGGTLSLLDVARAAAGRTDAEIARVPVGGTAESRPFTVAFTLDGRSVLVACGRAGCLSRVDVAAARPSEVARLPLTLEAGTPPLPRGLALTPDGRHAVVTGGARGRATGGALWLVDLATWRVVARVDGVGDEPYLVATLA